MRNLENYIKNKENPFEKMDPEVRYWLGYIFADGHLVYNEKHRVYSISLFSNNEQILNDYLEFLGSKAHLYKRPSGIMQVIYNSKPVTKWFMNTFQIPENKSCVLNPSIEIDWDILHGYFDGDGSIRNTLSKGKWKRYEAKFTTGSVLWANRIQDFLREEGVPSVIKQKGNAFDILISGKANLFYMYNKMYASGTSKLKYKYDIFVALFSDEQVNHGVNCWKGEIPNQQPSTGLTTCEGSETNS